MNKDFLAFISLVSGLCVFLCFQGVAFALAETDVPPVPSSVQGLVSTSVQGEGADWDNAACLACHDDRRVITVPDRSLYADPGDERSLVAIPEERYAQAVHGAMSCVACHTRITHLKPPHQTTPPPKIDCAACHETLAKTRQQRAVTMAQEASPVSSRMETVTQTIKTYRQAFHARPNKDDPTFQNATCHECHDSHFFNVPTDKNSPAYVAWRKSVPAMCGVCHEDQIEYYESSVHGVALLKKEGAKSAICTDCHTTHEMTGAYWRVFKQKSSDRCGACHPHKLKTYRGTYHGQVTQLGEIHTAKCFDCHESHRTLPAKDPNATIHPDNRLKTCQNCHDGKDLPLATAGFASVDPHAHDGAYDRYPQFWIASRFMSLLLWGVLAFFWVHAALWYYRERREQREQRERNTSPSVSSDALAVSSVQVTGHFYRFPRIWRIIHLVVVLMVMVLILTGMTLLNAHTAWAVWMVSFLGGVEPMGWIHRVAALGLVTLFLVHLVYVVQRLLRTPSFAWLGPDSLIPNKGDFVACRDMFRWFVGRGPKPQFDRWTYYEKFDYWAIFWGVTVMSISGLLLGYPHIAGQYLEGWVFNVAVLVHGEEAFLATLFLFTVHFFNNHVRPNTWPPPNLVMFTGTQSLETLKREHPAHFERLLAEGTLAQQCVEVPSRARTVGAKVLGWVLLVCGLSLLGFVVHGRMTF